MPIDAVKADVAQGLLRDCLDHGRVIQGKHFREELRNEGLEFPDAWHVLNTGCVSKPPEPHIKTGEWTYRIEGRTPDGISLAIVFSFKQVGEVFLITCFSLESKGSWSS